MSEHICGRCAEPRERPAGPPIPLWGGHWHQDIIHRNMRGDPVDQRTLHPNGRCQVRQHVTGWFGGETCKDFTPAA